MSIGVCMLSVFGDAVRARILPSARKVFVYMCGYGCRVRGVCVVLHLSI